MYKSQHVARVKPAPAAAPSAKTSACATESPAEKKSMSALQRRMRQTQQKAVFGVTQRGANRIVDLLEMYTPQAAGVASQRTDASSSATSSSAAAQAAGAHPVGIRISVKKRGCSGYSYTVNYEFDAEKLKLPPTGGIDGGAIDVFGNDAHVHDKGVHIFVDADALFYVIGTVMDFQVTNVEEKFTFANPNQAHSCGCGESFMPYDA